MDNIDKHKVMATLVRGFFEAFTSGVIDCHVSEPKEKFRPQTVKKVMIEHYGHIAGVFHDTLFYPIAGMNYGYEDIERRLRETDMSGMTMTGLMRIACRTDDMYQAMIAEYKRNFSQLLQGRHVTLAEHNLQHPGGSDGGGVSCDRAVALTVRTVMISYARGIRESGTGKLSLHQATIFRLLIDSMNALLGGIPMSAEEAMSTGGLHAMFMKACRTQHNFEVMTGEMDRVYEELVRTEGIISNDDKAN